MVIRKNSLTTVLLLAIALCLSYGAAIAQQSSDDIQLFISKFGQPDQIQTSENTKSQPSIATKRLIYKKENVRAVYIADTPPGPAGPYRKWKLIGLLDNRTGKAINPDEAAQRLEKRKQR